MKKKKRHTVYESIKVDRESLFLHLRNHKRVSKLSNHAKRMVATDWKKE